MMYYQIEARDGSRAVVGGIERAEQIVGLYLDQGLGPLVVRPDQGSDFKVVVEALSPEGHIEIPLCGRTVALGRGYPQIWRA